LLEFTATGNKNAAGSLLSSAAIMFSGNTYFSDMGNIIDF